MALLDKLDRKIGRYAPRNLMLVIVAGTAAVWLLEMMVGYRTGVSIAGWLYFNKAAILRGQVWRLITFIFVPSTGNLFVLAISLYFYWLIGTLLENEWGALRFDLFYLCGILGAIGSGFITGYATNYYLNLSLFLAFAILYPDFKVLLFYLIPIKMKWLALIDVVGLVLLFIFSTWIERIALLVALVNIALFFGYVPFRKLRAVRRRRKWKKATRTTNTTKSNTKSKNKNNDDEYPFEF